MRNLKKAMALYLALLLLLSFPVGASAAEVADATIDFSKTGSITIYKYNVTDAEKDGVWDSSYVSTGVYDKSGVVDVLGGNEQSTLGNGESSYGYAIKGVVFSYVKIADIVQFSESDAAGSTSGQVEILYGISKTKGADFLKALGLENGAQRYTNADHLDAAKYYYRSDTLIDALAAGLESNSTVVKNAMERYMAANGGIEMTPTDPYGKTSVSGLDLGLYLLVESSVPQDVVSTANPALISVPTTAVNGNNATDGGTRWIYDVCLFPKNLVGIPSLEKTLRESKADTGKHSGSTTDITDGYAHTGTASAGDIIDYQIVSTLPSITSESTYLSCYTFIDTLSPGLRYLKNDVVLEVFTDSNCTDLVTTWKEADGYFTVAYSTTSAGESVMTIEMTSRGLAEINSSKAVYPGASMVNSGFSDCTLRITYQAEMNSDDSLVYGDEGNPNDVVLTWRRSNSAYYDTLVDDAHTYVYGIELTKEFSDGAGNFANVEFILFNETDGYYVIAELDKESGIYYVTGHSEHEKDATYFVPVIPEIQPQIAEGPNYRIIIKGLEDDNYMLTEVRTDNGYTILRDDIEIVISQKESTVLCDVYAGDALGLLQNDPRYTQEIIDEAIAKGCIKTDGDLANILNNLPQKHLEHKVLTASATVDNNPVNMLEDDGSVNALAPLTVVNSKGFDLPATGDRGTWMYGLVGILLMAGSLTSIVLTTRKKRNTR